MSNEVTTIARGGIAALMLLFLPGPNHSTLYADEPTVAERDQRFLTEARRTIEKQIIGIEKARDPDQLLARLLILQSQTDPRRAFERAQKLKSPFYASLAMGGIAATELPHDPELSAEHLKAALLRTKQITHWTGSHPTSLELLIPLIAAYPRPMALELMETADDVLLTWEEGYADLKGDSYLEFAKVTTLFTPEKAQTLLLERSLKSNHYYASTAHLARFLARQSLEPTLALAEKHYRTKQDWPNDRDFLSEVLVELSNSDFPRAFAGVKQMEGSDREIALLKLARHLLDQRQQPAALEVVEYHESLKSIHSFSLLGLKRLQEELAGENKDQDPETISPQGIEEFLKAPDDTGLFLLICSRWITFEDQAQVRTFVKQVLPLARTMTDRGCSLEGYTRSEALGLMMAAAILAGDADLALAESQHIPSPYLRASFLMDAYEQLHPMPEVASQWPLFYFSRTRVSLK